SSVAWAAEAVSTGTSTTIASATTIRMTRMGSPLCTVAVEGTEGRSTFQRPSPHVRVHRRTVIVRAVSSPPFTRTIEGAPGDHGIDALALDDLVARAQREIDEGLLPSCQLAFARDGNLAVWITLGAAAAGSRYVIFSATKPVVASAMWILIGEGVLDVTRPVAEFVPEFGTNGKDVITVEQVMLHTSGFPRAPFVPLQWDDRAARLARFGAWRCN